MGHGDYELLSDFIERSYPRFDLSSQLRNLPIGMGKSGRVKINML